MTSSGQLQRIARAAGRAILFILLTVVATIAAGGLFGPALVAASARSGIRIRVDDLVNLIGVSAATAIMLRSTSRPWTDVGVSRAQFAPSRLMDGLLSGLLAIGLPALVLVGGGWLDFVPVGDGSSLAAALRVSLVLLPAALFEELLMRGYLLRAAIDGGSRTAAVVLTSVAFGLLHLANPSATSGSLLVVILAGIWLAVVRLATNSLGAAWMAHLAWNWVMAVPLHTAVSGIRFESPDYRGVASAPSWWTGGAWGPEGGLAAALGLLVAIGIMTRPGRREEHIA